TSLTTLALFTAFFLQWRFWCEIELFLPCIPTDLEIVQFRPSTTFVNAQRSLSGPTLYGDRHFAIDESAEKIPDADRPGMGALPGRRVTLTIQDTGLNTI